VNRFVESNSEWYGSGNYDSLAVSAQVGLAARVFHSQIERGIKPRSHFEDVLEVGALSGQHLPYVRHSFGSWTLTDVVDHPTGEFEDSRVSFSREDVHNMTFEDNRFDRVAAMCVVHHLDYPINALAEMRRVCKPGGILTILLPFEPGWAYSLGIRLTSVRKAKKLGLLEKALESRALGHRNHYSSLAWQFRETFKSDSVRVYTWPLPVGGRFLNMFSSWHIVKSLD